MNLDNYYRYFSSRCFPLGTKVYLFDDKHFAIDKDKSVRVFLLNNKNAMEELVVFFKSQFDYIYVFENGYILTAAGGKASVYNLDKLCDSFEYKSDCKLCFLNNAVMYTDKSGKKEISFMGSPDKTARELVSTYLGIKDGFDLLDASKSDFGNIYIKIQKDAQPVYLVFTPPAKNKNDFSIVHLPQEINKITLLKNGNFIVNFWSSSRSDNFGCTLYDSTGTALLSSVEEFGIRPLQDERHCVYQNALLVNENGSFIDEYRNELAISRNGYKIYAYTIDFGPEHQKGLWPGGRFQLSDSDYFCFWQNGWFHLVPMWRYTSSPINIVCDKRYAFRIEHALGL
ncbi:MAG: hypothetical protein J6C85_05585 [Alphaproteobacteria bacterium]|nr:hypothetical protein [Alphaproteobacteria bacterium]